MEVALTKMSQNGQIVIPAEVRRDAGIKAHDKFLVFNRGGNILLKPIDTSALSKEMGLPERVLRSEAQIKKGRALKADSRMSAEDIDRLLTA
jgi:AbrB family looped-hinge helix DNA binding protein